MTTMFPAARGLDSFGSSVAEEDKPSVLEQTFSSFSSVLIPPDAISVASSTETESSVSSGEERRRKKAKKKKKADKKRKQKLAKIVEERELDELKKKRVFLEDISGLSLDNAYRVDRSKESSILSFGCAYAGHVSKYRPGCYATLGRRDRFNPYEQRSSLRRRRRRFLKNRYFSGKNVKLVRVAADNLEKLNSDENLGDFIGFLKCGSAPANQSEEEDKSMDAEQKLVMLEVQKLNSVLREHPEDVASWLKLVDVQDRAVCVTSWSQGQGDDEGQSSSLKERRVAEKVVLDKRVAILERALRENPGDLQLRLRQLDVRRGFAEPESLRRDWQQMAFTYPNNMDVWLEYLDYLESDYVRFSRPAVFNVYEKCLSCASRLLSGRMLSHSVLPHTWYKTLGVFGRYCSRLRAAGLSERCTALWQAQADLTLHSPDDQVEQQEMNEVLERFWESSAARVGEAGAVGWNGTGERQEEDERYDVDVEEEAERAETRIVEETLHVTAAESLLMLEQSKEKLLWQPWRKCDDEEEPADLDSMVVIEDIRGALLPLWLAPMDVRRAFILLLLGQHGVHHVVEELGPLLKVFPRFYEWFSPVVLLAAGGVVGRISSEQVSLLEPVSCDRFVRNVLRQSTNCLDKSWCHRADELLFLETIKRCSGDRKSVRTAAKSLLSKPRNRSGGLGVWLRYALTESSSLGRLQEARRILDTALASWSTLPVSPGTEQEMFLQRLEVVRCYAETELRLPTAAYLDVQSSSAVDTLDVQQADIPRARHLLIYGALGDTFRPFCPSTDNEVTPSQQVKVTRVMDRCVTALINQLNTIELSHESVRSAVRLLALCSYLQSLFSLVTTHSLVSSSALRKCATNLRELWNRARAADQLVLSGFVDGVEAETVKWEGQLMWWQARRMRAGLSRARAVIRDGLRRHPSDLQLLQLATSWEWHSTNPGVLPGSLGRVMDSAMNAGGGLLPGVMLYIAYLTRWQRYGVQETPLGLLHRLRGLLERLVAVDPRRPLVWIQWLTFEAAVASGSGRVKDVFYRALREVPWSKAVYLKLVELCPGDGQEALDLLVEKELRQRVLLEEVPVLREAAGVK